VRPAREALSVRFAAALAGRGWPNVPVPPRVPSLESSLALRAARAAVGAPPVAAGLRAIDRIAQPLAARPLIVAAAALLCMPTARWLLPAPTGTMVATVFLSIGLLALALGWGARLHDAPQDRRAVLRLVLLGAALRLVFAVLIDWRGGFPDETSTYFPLAADAANNWANGAPSLLSEHLYVANRATYFYGLGGVFLLTGPTLMAGRIFGAVIGLFAALAAGEVARGLAGRRAAVIAVGLLALHPEHAFWNATLSRDGLSTFLVLVVLAVVLRSGGRFLSRGLLAALPALGLLWWNSFITAGWIGATLAVVLLAEAVATRDRAQSGAARRFVLPIAALALVGAALVWGGHRYGSFVTPGMIGTIRTIGSGATADFLPNATFATWGDVLLHLPLGSLFVLGAPFPWDAVHAHRAAYGLLAAAGLGITVVGVAGFVALLRAGHQRVAPLMVFAVVTLTSLALLEGMAGIVVRHRLPLTAVLACTAAVWIAGALEPRASRGVAA